MPAIQAANAAKQRNATVERRAGQRRATLKTATGLSQSPPPNDRPYRPPRRPPRRSSGGNVRQYYPTTAGKEAGSSIGALEAEFLGALALLFLTLFTDTTASYNDKILAVMKRGTLLAITFFILALLSGQGPNAARVAKAFGGLIVIGLILSVASDTMLSEVDNFIKGTWKGDPSSTGSGSSDQAQAGSGNLGEKIKGAVSDAGAVEHAVGQAPGGTSNPLAAPGLIAGGLGFLNRLGKSLIPKLP